MAASDVVVSPLTRRDGTGSLDRQMSRTSSRLS